MSNKMIQLSDCNVYMSCVCYASTLQSYVDMLGNIYSKLNVMRKGSVDGLYEQAYMCMFQTWMQVYVAL